MKGNKYIIGITIGDPAGIGPEIILKALKRRDVKNLCTPVIITPEGMLSPEEFVLFLEKIKNNIPVGKVSKEGGMIAGQSIELAVKLAVRKKISAMVTAPINKEGLNLAGYKFPGHTEMLANLTNTKRFAMMLAGDTMLQGSTLQKQKIPPLRVVLVTTHCAIKDISKNLTIGDIFDKISITNKYLKKYFRIKQPKIAVTALNPHASDGGIFGNEEQEIIIPAVRKAVKMGIEASGPFPADSLFHYYLKGIYDAIVVMYHDQGLIPLKMLYYGKAVNITLGLPIIRTSVDHGTGYDIAGKGIANEESLVSAIKMAIFLAKNKSK